MSYDNSIFAKNLTRFLSMRDETQSDIARILKVSKASVSAWCSGQTIPRMDKIAFLADYFHTSVSELMGDMESDIYAYENIIPLKSNRIPLLGEIACGEPSYADEDFEFYVEAGTDIKADFCLRCKGDSMINARINDGDIVFIRKQDSVNNGEIAAVIIEDSATLKRVYQNGDIITLVAENPAFAPLVFAASENKDIKILGKAIAFQSDVR